MRELITLDPERCHRCGACVEVCPIGIIARQEAQLPVLDHALLPACIRCGHCSSVCPHGAWSPSGSAAAEVPAEALQRGLAAAVKSRRSIREFTDRPVPSELIQSSIETACYAPTAGNSRSVRWLVINGSARVRRFAELTVDWFMAERDRLPPGDTKVMYQFLSQRWASGHDVVCRGAPALVFVHAPDQQLSPAVDCTLALGTFDLLAWTSGLGTCWAGFILMALRAWSPLRDHLALPPGHVAFGAMMVGFPRHRYRTIPDRDPAAVEWRS
jgi:nitroreductase/NAD-dependent dihydropyrimidine dehydrogenase PreA subunit